MESVVHFLLGWNGVHASMKTSYFAKYKKPNGVSIARGTPKWFNGPLLTELMPSWDIINRVKSGSITHDVYEEIYRNEVLSILDPLDIYQKYEDSVLLCWERIGEFCHRRIVASWIEEETGNEVEEYGTWKI